MNTLRINVISSLSNKRKKHRYHLYINIDSKKIKIQYIDMNMVIDLS